MALQGWLHNVNYRLLTRGTTSDVWTLAVWVYPTSDVMYSTPIQSRDNGRFLTILRSGGGSYWTADYKGQSNNYQRATGITVELNKWQLVVATIDAVVATNEFVIYKGADGVITSFAWSAGSGNTIETFTNWRQYDSNVPGRQFPGRIAVSAVWNTVLSSGDVSTLYNGGDGVDPATIQPSFCRISNYFDDTELGIDGATDGASTYSDVGVLTTVAGPFSPSGYGLVCDNATFNLTGQNNTLKTARHIVIGHGLYNLTGQTTELKYNRILTQDQASFNLTGQNNTLKTARNTPIGHGLYNLTGQTVGLINPKTVELDPAVYTLNGQDLEFNTGLKLQADAGSFITTGQAVDLRQHRKHTLDSTTFTTNGQPVYLLHGHKLFLVHAIYALDGQPVDLTKNTSYNLENGVYTLSGQTIDQKRSYVLNTEQGVFITRGQTIGPVISPESGTMCDFPASFPVPFWVTRCRNKIS